LVLGKSILSTFENRTLRICSLIILYFGDMYLLSTVPYKKNVEKQKLDKKNIEKEVSKEKFQNDEKKFIEYE
jgi:hypothetical protein